MRGLLGSGGRGHVGVVLTETSDAEFLGHREEGVEVVLLDVHLALVHEVENGGQVTGSHVLNDQVSIKLVNISN